MPPFSEYVAHEKICGLVASAQNEDHFTHFLSPVTFPMLSLIPQILRTPHLQGDGSEICSLISAGCLVNKPFLCCKPQPLSQPLTRWVMGKQTWLGNTSTVRLEGFPARVFTLCCSRFRCIVLAVSSWTCWMVISSLRATSALYNQAPMVPRGAGRDLSSCICQSKSWNTK